MCLKIMLMVIVIMIMMLRQVNMHRCPLHSKKGCDQKKKQRFVEAETYHVNSGNYLALEYI